MSAKKINEGGNVKKLFCCCYSASYCRGMVIYIPVKFKEVLRKSG